MNEFKKYSMTMVSLILFLYIILFINYYIFDSKTTINKSKEMTKYSFVPNVKHHYEEYFGSYVRFSYIKDFMQARKINYSFDKLGYRNYNYSENKNYKIVFFGDSFLWGCSNDDKYVMANYINDNSNLRSYSFAKSPTKQIIEVYKSGFFENHKTKVIVLGMLEEYFKTSSFKYILKEIKNYNKINNYRYNILIRNNKQKEFKDNGVLSLANIKALLNNILFHISMDLFNKYSFGNLEIYKTNTPIFTILNKTNSLVINTINKNDALKLKKYAETVNYMKQISDFFLVQGIRFIFVPIPNSTLMYAKKIKKINLPNNHANLIKELKGNDIIHIDTLKLLKESNKRNLWLYDDPHWSENSIKLVGDKLIELLKKDLNK